MLKKRSSIETVSSTELAKCEFMPTAPVGGAVYLHGLGDHGERNYRSLQRFVQQGMHCIALDLPGHGRSPGQRGYIPSFEAIFEVIRQEFSNLRQSLPSGAPLRLLGHSMGGLIALRYLIAQPTQRVNFAWISSPLIRIQAGENWLLNQLSQTLDQIAPKLSIKMRFSSERCKRDPITLAETKSDVLIHRHLTIHLIQLLLTATRSLPQDIKLIDPKLKLLMTHGSADSICPSQYSQDLFASIPCIDKSYILLEGLLHEPFHDLGKETCFQVLDDWLAHVLEDYSQSNPKSNPKSIAIL